MFAELLLKYFIYFEAIATLKHTKVIIIILNIEVLLVPVILIGVAINFNIDGINLWKVLTSWNVLATAVANLDAEKAENCMESREL